MKYPSINQKNILYSEIGIVLGQIDYKNTKIQLKLFRKFIVNKRKCCQNQTLPQQNKVTYKICSKSQKLCRTRLEET